MIARQLRSPGAGLYVRRAVDHCESPTRKEGRFHRNCAWFWCTRYGSLRTSRAYTWRSPIERTLHAKPGTVQYVRVDHRRAHVSVTEEFLHSPNVRAGFEQVRREGVPESVASRQMRPAGNTHCHAHAVGALGNLRASASRNATRPSPAARSAA